MWFDQSSTFALELTQIQGVEVKVFRWSGDNSYLERYRAASCLAYRIMQCHDATNPPVQVIVAHSHGGSVALMASLHPWAKALTGVVTMGTPFLNIERRTEDDRQENLLGYLQSATLLLVGATTMVALFAALSTLGVLSSVDTTGSATWPFTDLNWPATLVLLATLLTLGGVFQRVAPIRNAVKEKRNWSINTRLQWLILRAPADEASHALDLARKAYKAFDFTWRRLRTVLAAIAPVLKYGWPMVFLLAPFLWLSSALAAFARWSFLSESWLVAWRHVAPVSGWVDVGAPFAIPVILALLALGFLLFAAGLFMTPFGWEFFVMGLVFEIDARTMPPDYKTVVTEVSPTWPGRRHSLYESAEVRKSVADWIEQLARSSFKAGKTTI